MKKSTALTLGFLAVLVALSFTLILTGNNIMCEVCIEYNGTEVCEKVQGKDKQEMVQLGVSTACAGAANGRTESMECGMTPPKKVECTES